MSLRPSAGAWKAIGSRLVLILHIGALFTGSNFCAMAQLFAPKWEATVKVVGESGIPVGGANVMIGYYVEPGLASKNRTEKARR